MEKILERIKIVCAQRDVTIKELTKNINMTEAGFYRAIKTQSLRIKTLQEISDVLGVEIGFFFKEEYYSIKSNLNTTGKTLIEICSFAAVTNFKLKDEKSFSNIDDFKKRLANLYKDGYLAWVAEQIEQDGDDSDFTRIKDKLLAKLYSE